MHKLKLLALLATFGAFLSTPVLIAEDDDTEEAPAEAAVAPVEVAEEADVASAPEGVAAEAKTPEQIVAEFKKHYEAALAALESQSMDKKAARKMLKSVMGKKEGKEGKPGKEKKSKKRARSPIASE